MPSAVEHLHVRSAAQPRSRDVDVVRLDHHGRQGVGEPAVLVSHPTAHRVRAGGRLGKRDRRAGAVVHLAGVGVVAVVVEVEAIAEARGGVRPGRVGDATAATPPRNGPATPARRRSASRTVRRSGPSTRSSGRPIGPGCRCRSRGPSRSLSSGPSSGVQVKMPVTGSMLAPAGRARVQAERQTVSRSVHVRCGGREGEQSALVHCPVANRRQRRGLIDLIHRDRNCLVVKQALVAVVGDADRQGERARPLGFGRCPGEDAGDRVDALRPKGRRSG